MDVVTSLYPDSVVLVRICISHYIFLYRLYHLSVEHKALLLFGHRCLDFRRRILLPGNRNLSRREALEACLWRAAAPEQRKAFAYKYADEILSSPNR